jgi:ELWxxDGT repeat protein
VVDLDPSLDAGGLESPFERFMPVGGQVFFVSPDQVELFATDGTGIGTRAVASSISRPPEALYATQNHLFSISRTRDFLFDELWVTDATPSSPRLLLTGLRLRQDDGIHAAATSTRLLLANCPPRLPCQLWSSDATETGTELLREFLLLRDLQAVGESVFFFAGEPGDQRWSLWRSDGTAGGTRKVATLPVAYHPFYPATVGGKLLFFAENGPRQVWASDGTTAGTLPLTDLAVNELSLGFWRWIAGGKAYFWAPASGGPLDLWESDGTPAGTKPITAFAGGGGFGPHASQPLPIGSRVFFVATHLETGATQLWTTAGSPATARPVGGCGDDCPTLGSAPWMLPVANSLVVAGNGPRGDSGIWSADPNGLTLSRVATLCPGCGSVAMGALPKKAFFAVGGDDPSLWATDGTAAGTRRLTEASWLGGGIAWRGALLFSAEDGKHGYQLWRSDGTPGGTFMLSLFGAGDGSFPWLLTAAGSRLVFVACSPDQTGVMGTAGPGEVTLLEPEGYDCRRREGYGTTFATYGDTATFLLGQGFPEPRELWSSAGTPETTRLLASFSGARIDHLAVFGGNVWFPVSLPDGRTTFWRSGGTEATTEEAFDLPGSGVLRDVTALGSEMFFVYDEQAWRSGGSAGGTFAVTDFENVVLDRPGEFTRAGGWVYFVAGGDLWRSNGSPTGASLVFSAPGGEEDRVVWLAELGGELLFSAPVDGGDRSLYRIGDDGAAILLQGGLAPEGPTARGNSARLGGALLFSARDGAHGVELWRSDGTAAGTLLVKDLAPGRASSRPASFAATPGRLYFTADDGIHGGELWSSDGTAPGTRMVQDLAPSALSSRPQELTAAGPYLYFSADDGVYGRELWALPLDPALPPCVAGDEHLCLGAGRFKVEAFWRDFQGGAGRGHAVSLTSDTGYFWFFGPENLEAIVKVLDGRGLNGHHWVFYGALTNVEYSLTVTDTVTGAARRYVNPPGRFASVGDTAAFGPQGARGSDLTAGPASVPSALIVEEGASALPQGACAPSATRLCLNGGRFALETQWRDFRGLTGVGTAVSLTGDTGYFWFFDQANVEVVAKVLDGRTLNGKFWLFYGALSNVEYTLTVTDTATGQRREYRNPSGRFASVGDTGAF